eukprot:CAMPEP_0177465458 /NCGR_PEP_ID=MMETSP0369-20130122/17423_1 /TAXON_ID=447022 ORGANISM="Scrippsiella hangoei-like, Strain SHHI-4" /NCGR_SAMPLE_ID=MMETSP0369 /ASSEMBLY_ACC=CAM_ASM_000364 /LENGTH=440 /DNA_ID=CAMNT_0018939341 /DNA_START=104 /DNA_END=1426 /DNA_ORIENTATION=+
MAHAQQFPTFGESRVMECMVYADHARERRLQQKITSADPEVGHKSPSIHDDGSNRDPEEGDDSDDEKVENYQLWGGDTSSSKILMVPSREASFSSGGLGVAAADAAAAAAAAAAADGPERSKSVKVLRKPFFKDWNDFMDFDLTFKKKMPITCSELTLLLEKEQEDLTNWDVCVDRKEIRVAKVQTGTGCITLRAWATVPGINVYVAFYLFYNLDERVKWDKVLENGKLVEANMQGSEVIYCLMKIPGVTNREFLQYRRAFLREDGSIVIVLRSAEHLDMPEGKGECKGNIRVESFISGYVLRQSYDDQGKPVLQIFLMSCADIKGLVPKWIINFVAPKKPAEWVDTLHKACQVYQDAHPRCEDELREYVQRFRKENPFDYEAGYEADVVEATALAPQPKESDPALAPAGGNPPRLVSLAALLPQRRSEDTTSPSPLLQL